MFERAVFRGASWANFKTFGMVLARDCLCFMMDGLLIDSFSAFNDDSEGFAASMTISLYSFICPCVNKKVKLVFFGYQIIGWTTFDTLL